MNSAISRKITIDRFEASDIDADEFDHEAHVYVGWLYVQQFELSTAISRFDAALRRLVTKLGADGKYHATLTWFFLLLIADRTEDDETWKMFKSRNMDLVRNSRDVLSRYYSNGHLFSDRARERFVLPDNVVIQSV
jgi:hypothetical protein